MTDKEIKVEATMSPIEKKELELALMEKAMNNPYMVEYLMPPRYITETYQNRSARRKQKRRNKKK